MSLIHIKLSKIAAQIPPIPKNGLNKDDNYKFRNMYDIYNSLNPLFKSEGVYFTPKVLDSSETIINTNKGRAFRVKLKVEWTISCEDGSSVVAVVNGEGIDPSDKASNKAMTASLKYLLIYKFLIPTLGDVDADSTSYKIPPFEEPPQSEPKPKSLLAFAESKGLTRADLLKIGEKLGLNPEADLSPEDRKKIYKEIEKVKN